MDENQTHVAEEEPRRRGWLKWLLGALAGVLVLAGGAYVAAYFIAGNQVPSESTVEGVAIGGMSPEEALTTLQSELGPAYQEPITITDDQGNEAAVEPAESGLVPDFEQAVRDAGGGLSWDPRDIYFTLTGGTEVELPLLVDQDQLRSVVEETAPSFAKDAVDATVALEGTEIVRTPSEQSSALDVDATTVAVQDAFLAREDSAAAALTHEDPKITDEMVDEVVTSFAEPALSGPITVKVGDEQSYEITTEQIASVISFNTNADGVTGHADIHQLMEDTQEARNGLDLGAPKNASYRLESGTITVVPAEEGLQMSEENLAENIETALTKTGEERVVQADTEVKQPEFTTAEAEQLKPREVIGEFTTHYPHANYRNVNIGRAAELMNGTVLLPGATFSFNDTLGERTEANGFTDGYVIEGGRLIRASGGGISQAATTAFNAGFFAGYEDVEHKPHSLYFPRYPAGREATVVWGAVDLKFRNDTQYPAVIQSYTNKSSPGNRGSITVKIYSQKTWENVTATETQRSNYTSGTDRTVSGPNCEPQAPIQGFTATYKRQFWQSGSVAKEEDFRWTYSPGDRITCE